MDPVIIQLILFALASSSDDSLDHAKIASKIKNGDQKAFQTFFEFHFQSLMRFLQAKGVSVEDSKDIIQQAFIYIWDHRQDINPEKSLRAYIFKIAYTRMINLIRDNKKFDSSELAEQKKHNHLTPQNKIQHSQILQLIQKAITNMPERRSMVFDLCFMQEFTYKETAEMLEISVKTVENHMALALKDVRTALKNHGLGTLR